MHHFDSYPLKSNLRNTHPNIKIMVFVVFIILALLSKSVWFSTLLLSSHLIAIYHTTHIKPLKLLKLMVIPISFLLLGCIAVMVEINSPDSLYHLSIWKNSLSISRNSFSEGTILFFRSLSSISVLYFLILNTSINDILYSLRSLGTPTIVQEIMLLVYRNIFTFTDTAQAIHLSQKSRLGNKNLRSTIRSFGLLGGRLFILAEVRATHLYRSMESRGFSGNLRNLPREWRLNTTFTAISAVLAIAFSLALFL